MLNKNHSIANIGTRRRILRTSLLDNWEISNFLLYYLEELKPLIKTNSIKQFTLLDIDNVPGKFYKGYRPDILLGVISRIENKTLFKTILIDQVSQTEDFLQDLMYIVYRDYPEKLASVNNDQAEDSKKYQKLLQLILKSDDKESMVEKLIEEKIRGIFYGKPLDFFKQDKAKLGFNDFFKSNYNKTLDKYQEILARRNIYTHNNGRVDNKYLSEVKNSTFKHGEKAILDLQYITDATRICVAISALAMKLVIENIYKENVKNRSVTKILKDLVRDYEK